MPTWPIRFNLNIDHSNIELLECAARIQATARVIREIPIPPATQKRIDHLNILRAIRGTTAIEGNTLDEEAIDKLIKNPATASPEKLDKDGLEVVNAAKAMGYITQTLNKFPDRPLTQDVIREIHQITTCHIPYPHNIPGHYRTHPVNAGLYIPPRTGEEVRNLMAEFERWLTQTAQTNPVIRAISAHFYFISIHPFGDGNGRTARAIESYLLYQGRINARGFYSLANFYYKNREEYVVQLDRVRFQSNGDLTEFILFAMRGLDSELNQLHEEVLGEARRTAFRDYAREFFQGNEKLRSKNGARMISLLVDLTRVPNGISISDLLARKDPSSGLYAQATNKTITRDINYLQKEGLVIVKDGRLQARLELMTKYTA